MFLSARDNYVPAFKYLTAKSDLDLNLIELVKAQMEAVQSTNGHVATPETGNSTGEVIDKPTDSPAQPTLMDQPPAETAPTLSPIDQATEPGPVVPSPEPEPASEEEEAEEEEEEAVEDEAEEEVEEEEDVENEVACEDDLEDLVVGDEPGTVAGEGEDDDLELDEEDW